MYFVLTKNSTEYVELSHIKSVLQCVQQALTSVSLVLNNPNYVTCNEFCFMFSLEQVHVEIR